MSHVFSAPVSLAKWLRRKRKAYNRRKQATVSSVQRPELIFKQRQKPLLRSQTVGYISSDSFSGVDLEVDTFSKTKLGIFDTKQYNETQERLPEGNPTVLVRPWSEQKPPALLSRTLLKSKALVGLKKRFAKPAIRIDKIDQILETSETRDDWCENIKASVSPRPDSKEVRSLTSSRHISEETIFENQAEELEKPSDVEQKRRHAWGDPENSPSYSRMKDVTKPRSPEKESSSLQRRTMCNAPENNIQSHVLKKNYTGSRKVRHGSPPNNDYKSPSEIDSSRPGNSFTSLLYNGSWRSPSSSPVTKHRPAERNKSSSVEKGHYRTDRSSSYDSSPQRSTYNSPERTSPTFPMRTTRSSPIKTRDASSMKSQDASPKSSFHPSPQRSLHASPQRRDAVSPPRSRPVSPQRSRPVSPPRSRVVSPPRSRPVSPPRSRPVSPPRSRPVSPQRSRPVSPPRSRPVSPPRSRPVSLRRSRPVSPQRSHHASPRKSRQKNQKRMGIESYRGKSHFGPQTISVQASSVKSRSNTPVLRSSNTSPSRIHQNTATEDHLYELRNSLNTLNLRNAPSTSASSRHSTPSRGPRGTSTSSQRSSSTSRASTPEYRCNRNVLGVPPRSKRSARRRSPSPRPRGSVSGSYYSPASSRAPSRDHSSEDWDSSDQGSPTVTRRGRSLRRRRKSFSDFKPKFINPDTDYRRIVYPQIPDVEPGFEPLVRFRRAVKSIQVLLRATDRSRNTAQITAPSTLSWVQIHNELEQSRKSRAEQGLLFDPGDYKAKRELQLSSEAKAILSMEPSKRTPEQLHVALVAMNQSVEAFSEFPLKMQESLVRVGFFENFEANRVIIRQGHFADNFYLILNGLAVVTILETDKHMGEPRVRTAAFLKKGNSFGELALMHGALRSATVTCKESVELLAVGRQDFIDVFMHVEKDREPEHIGYLRCIDVFQGWPIETLPYDNPKICLFTYFRKGVLLCKDSCRSDWVYIIKSGTCKVLKQLNITKQDNTRLKFFRKNKWLNSRPNVRLISQENRGKKTPLNSEKGNKNGKVGKTKRKLPWVRDRGDDELQISSERHLEALEDIYSAKHPEPETLSDDLNEMFDSAGSETSTRHSPEASHADYTDVTPDQHRQHGPYPDCQSTEDSQINTYSSEHPRTEPSAYSSRTCSEAPSVFVQVARLGPKDVFGLEEPVLSALSPITSVSLVSDGAECILVNRKFFMQHLTDVELKRLRLTIQPYPTTEELERKLRDKKNWEAYKVMALNDHLAFTRYVQDTLSLYY